MTHATETLTPTPLDFSLPSGCPLCGGPVAIRMTPDSARAVCPQCRWLTEPKVHATDGGLQLEFTSSAQA